MWEKRAWVVGIGLLVLAMGQMPVVAQEGVEEPQNRLSYDFPDKGGFRFSSTGDDELPDVFYAGVEPSGGSTLPSGFGIFSFRNLSGALTTETSVPIQGTLTNGRMFAVFSDRSDIGIAIANPNDADVTIDFFFSNPILAEPDFGEGSITIPARGQVSRFLSQEPFNFPENTTGTMTFSASLPVSAVAMLQTTNVAGDIIYNTLPVVDLDIEPGGDPVFLPHVAIGGAVWSTDFVLMNPTDEEIQGVLGVVSTGSLYPGNPTWDIPGQTIPTTFSDTFIPQLVHSYTLPPRGVVVWSSVTSLILTTGSARVTPAEGDVAPAVQVIFNSLDLIESADGTPVLDRTSRAAYSGGSDGTAYRMYVESRGELGAPDSVSSGVAIQSTNWINRRGDEYDRVRVGLELRSFDGAFTASTELEIASSGQRAMFVDQMFPDIELPDPFYGTLTVTVLSPERRIAATALRARVSPEGRNMVTTTPPTEANSAPAAAIGYMPHLVTGGGWETETVLYSGINGQAPAGDIVATGTDGMPYPLPPIE